MPPRPRPRLSFYAHIRLRPHAFHTTPHPFHPRSKPTPPPPRPSSSDDYYSLLLSQPLASPSLKSFAPPSSTHPSSTSSPKGPSRDPTILFGTPLAGPSAARRRAGYGDEPYATGGLERPHEPDNCCMSGCVNCVWDAYREEVEAWAVRRREAAKVSRDRGRGQEEEEEKRKAREMRRRGRRMVGGSGGGGGDGGAGDMDLDDEGGLFAGVPVGIREFMATEKRLRERREKDEKENQDKR